MPFEITVVRGQSKGKLKFSHDQVKVDTVCWWDSKVKIDAGEYTGYATRMANKSDGSDGGKRQGIWLGKDVPYKNGTKFSDGIFIHKGTSAVWSDGCIVAHENEVVKIWNAIHPKEKGNVTVKVTDE